jgi:hypothetical protein
MWPYNDDENGWLGQNSALGNSTGLVQITPELIAFHEQRARELRRETMAALATNLLAGAGKLFQQLGALTSGNRAKMEATIAEFRRPTVGTAGR